MVAGRGMLGGGLPPSLFLHPCWFPCFFPSLRVSLTPTPLTCACTQPYTHGHCCYHRGTPLHPSYRVAWTRQFPVYDSCDPDIWLNVSYTSGIRLTISVDNLVLWSQVADEAMHPYCLLRAAAPRLDRGLSVFSVECRTNTIFRGVNTTQVVNETIDDRDSMKYKAKSEPGDAIHFIAGTTAATLAFEVEPLAEDGCKILLDEVHVTDAGPYNVGDLLSSPPNKEGDPLGTAKTRLLDDRAVDATRGECNGHLSPSCFVRRPPGV